MPSKGTLWNLSEWISRLGLHRQDQPEIKYDVQPVMMMADASALTSPLLPAMAWAGGFIVNVPAEFPGMAVRALAPGGSFLKIVTTSAFSNLGIFNWEIGSSLHSFDTDGALRTLQQMGPDEVVAEVRLGSTIVPMDTTDSPGYRGVALQVHSIVDGFYLSQGTEFYIEMSNNFPGVTFSVLIHDVPVTIPEN